MDYAAEKPGARFTVHFERLDCGADCVSRCPDSHQLVISNGRSFQILIN